MGGTMWWNDSMEAATLSWVSITPFGVPVVPLVKMSWKTSPGSGRFQAAWRASQSGGKSGSSLGGLGRQVLDSGRREVGEAGFGRIGRVTARAEDEVAGPDARTMPFTASADIRRSSGTMTSRACIAPK